MTAIRDILSASPVMPVIVLDRVEDAVPLARALVAGGIRVLEVTMRTAVALDCVTAIRVAVPDAIVGVGTITSAADLDAARAAGAVFGVSPGATPALLARAAETGMPLLPGVMTPSDVMQAVSAGFSAMKLFPAKQAGGINMLKALGGPFPNVMFCPTGGIDAESAPAYLALNNVACVGGSWLAPPALVKQGDWSTIEQLARAASTHSKSK
ncbi:MAG: bifunctional 4-hydroxy-2-oxoglutarate aldolase/2-dehydro-3-deoxy-phosphogluconate aldolase [Betaproteobacteria bacterium]|nr:bifunctional 4-hydroxy-2-oxoglutarate aldolase/2-dehydro-3-deoxy-phosphogluconate aldolase [Betaproteobacteria bacterium]